MSWKTLNHSIHTLRFKVACGYSVLFLLSFTIIFSAAGLLIRRNSRDSIDRRLHEFSLEMEYIYCTGDEPCHLLCEPNSVRDMMTLAKRIRLDCPPFTPFLYAETPQGQRIIFGHAGGNAICKVEIHGDVLDLSTLPQTAFRDALQEEFNQEAYEEGKNLFWFALLAPNGTLLAQSPLPDTMAEYLEGNTFPKLSRSALTFSDHDTRFHVRRLFDDSLLVCGGNLEQASSWLAMYMSVLTGLGTVAVIIGTFACWLLAGNVVNGIRNIGDAATQISTVGNYALRVPDQHDSHELKTLAQAFNSMVAVTEKRVAELRNFSQDIAHDLRTPLTRLLGKAELAANGQSTTELPYDVAEECQNMLAMINTMLAIANAESRPTPANAPLHDLRPDTEAVVSLYEALADDRHITLACHCPETALPARISKIDLERILANLLDNALKFTPENGSVNVTLQIQNGQTVLTVADTGCGIRPEDIDHIFDRGFRSDTSRSVPGSGLGLCLVKALAESNGATLSLASPPGQGTTFTIAFPPEPAA